LSHKLEVGNANKQLPVRSLTQQILNDDVEGVECKIYWPSVVRSLMWCVQVVEYDSPSVLLDNPESAFSRLVEASEVDNAMDSSTV